MHPTTRFLTLCLCAAGWSATDSVTTMASRPLPMELGGFFTYDLAAPATRWENGDVPLALSWMELSARVPVADHLVGAITLLSKDGPRDIRIWQCVAAWEDSGTTIVAGQQNFHHGLLTTRLVSNPLHWDSAWRNAPGLEVSRTGGSWTVGIGVASPLRSDPDSSGPAKSDPSGSGYVDWIPAEGSVVRLSGAAARQWRDFDAAANLAMGPLLLDGEWFGRFRDAGTDLYAGSGGIAFQTGPWTVGTRYDRLTIDGGETWQGRTSAGGVLQFWQAMFAGAELSRTDRGAWGLDFQVGLTSHMKVPGFTPSQPGR